MATPKPAKAEKKPKVEGAPRFQRRSFTLKKPLFAVPTQGLEHIIFDNTGTAKATSTFNLNIEAISKHIANRLKFDGPLAALAVRELKAPTISFPNNPTDPTNLVETTKWQIHSCTRSTKVVGREHSKNLQPCDATFHARDEN
jgi:hypothetical protein